MKVSRFFVLLPVVMAALSFQHPAHSVAETELAFAKLSRQTNTVNAFMKYLATDAVMFREGEPIDGLSLWRSRTPDSTLLNWWPIIADASAAGDLGYTTGPYQFFNQRADESPAGNGYYSTIWQKQKDGSWKIKVDLGVRLSSLTDLPTQLNFVPAGKSVTKTTAALKDFDNKYNSILNTKSVSFDPDYFGKNYRIHRALIGPKVNATSDVLSAEKDQSFKFQFMGGEESSSRDFAYAYGNVTRTDKDGVHKANYLRVWKNEGGTWKIVLDVVTEG